MKNKIILIFLICFFYFLNNCYATCLEGTYCNDTNCSQCIPCPEGTYCNHNNCTNCSSCPAGSYSGIGFSNCILCPLGSYCNHNNCSQCTLCPEGTYCNHNNCTNCSSCPAGTYSGIGFQHCISCPAGTYSNELSSTCTPCPAGTYSSETGANNPSICKLCSVGTYSSSIGANSSSTCISCPAGTYSNVTGANSFSTCISCPAGTYSNIIRATDSSSCISCPAGTYSSETGANNSSTCKPCPAGTYSNIIRATDSSSCISCPAGTYSSVTGANNSSTCTPCPAGTYSNVINATDPSSCILCPAGTYSNVTNATDHSSCILCPTGTFSILIGANNSSTCISCPAGTYSNKNGSHSCILCPAGTYTNQNGSSSCKKCPDTQTSFVGSTSCSILNKINSKLIAAIVVPIAIMFLISIAIGIFLYKRYKRKIPIEMIDISSWKVLENIEIQERLGGGNFGDVYKGIWNGTTEVALKKLKSKEYLEQFIQEASILQSLMHPNIVQFFGMYNSPSNEQYIVMEYIPKGSLDQVLITEKDLLKVMDLVIMSKHAAAGMEYLEEQQIVHRDLALRNLLVSIGDEKDKYIIKISDFGLSKPMEKEYYRTNDQTIPVRWCAPEVLEQGIYSSKSDVWSFGIVLWEIFTYGMIPYTNALSNQEIMEKVLSGYKLEQPDGCPNEIYELMLKCWNYNRHERPTFKQIYDIINEIQKKISIYHRPSRKIFPIKYNKKNVFKPNDNNNNLRPLPQRPLPQRPLPQRPLPQRPLPQRPLPKKPKEK